jgi:hypothetical protein
VKPQETPSEKDPALKARFNGLRESRMVAEEPDTRTIVSRFQR